MKEMLSYIPILELIIAVIIFLALPIDENISEKQQTRIDSITVSSISNVDSEYLIP